MLGIFLLPPSPRYTAHNSPPTLCPGRLICRDHINGFQLCLATEECWKEIREVRGKRVRSGCLLPQIPPCRYPGLCFLMKVTAPLSRWPSLKVTLSTWLSPSEVYGGNSLEILDAIFSISQLGHTFYLLFNILFLFILSFIICSFCQLLREMS